MFLIKSIGIFGAGIATALSYLLIGTMRMKTVKKNFNLQIDYKRMLSIIYKKNYEQIWTLLLAKLKDVFLRKVY